MSEELFLDPQPYYALTLAEKQALEQRAAELRVVVANAADTKCAKCGEKVPAGATQCPQCRAKVAAPAPAPGPSAAERAARVRAEAERELKDVETALRSSAPAEPQVVPTAVDEARAELADAQAAMADWKDLPLDEQRRRQQRVNEAQALVDAAEITARVNAQRAARASTNAANEEMFADPVPYFAVHQAATIDELRAELRVADADLATWRELDPDELDRRRARRKAAQESLDAALEQEQALTPPTPTTNTEFADPVDPWGR